MGMWADVDAVVEQLERGMKETGRNTFGSGEVSDLVREAAERLLVPARAASGPELPYIDRFPIVPEDAQEERSTGRGRR